MGDLRDDETKEFLHVIFVITLIDRQGKQVSGEGVFGAVSRGGINDFLPEQGQGHPGID